MDGWDHHPAAWSAVLAGGGRAGQASGSTDEAGAKVTAKAVAVPNYFATLATLLQMDPDKDVTGPVSWPIAISELGKPIAGLIGG